MTTLSDEKINSILSLTENNKCLECGNTSVDWVSFPTTVFLCSACCKKHRDFSKKEILKSVSISEFTEQEIAKMASLGGNERYQIFLKQYDISIKEPTIENKYLTTATAYYNALLEVEANKLKLLPGSEDAYNKLVGLRPPAEIGPQLMGDNPDQFMEVAKTGADVSAGGFLGYIGNQIHSASEQMGINKAYNDAKNKIDTKLTEYGLKDKVDATIDYAKKAGEFIYDKGKEIAETPMVKGVVDKVSIGVNNVKESAENMIHNLSKNNDNNSNAPQQPQNPPSNSGNSANDQNVYQQLNNDHL